ASRFQVVMYDRDGHYLGKIGESGQEPGCFARPRGVEVDKSGWIYAVDAAFDNVQIFDKKGQLLLFFGGPGRKPGDLTLPSKVFLDYDQDDIKQFSQYASSDFEIDHLVVVTSQFGKRLVNVYGFGKSKGKNYPSEEELRRDAIDRLQKWLKENPPSKEGKKEELDKNS
ncbi:MAG: hypothetical protein M0017_12495, partial [Desulfobacteraceae bacterium]|nr:hypothetical protein [Desulfobacteraceae bacterium]